MRLLIIMLILAIPTAIHAQDGIIQRTDPQLGTPVQDPQQEARSLSGKLKDLLGQVHEQLGKVDQDLKEASTERTNELLASKRNDLLEIRSDLEEALGQVNTSDRTNWPAISDDVNELIHSTTERLKELKIGTASAVN